MNEVDALDRCYGASNDVLRAWTAAKHAGRKISLDKFTEEWVMNGEEEPDPGNYILWGAYQQELSYRKSLLYR